MSNATAEKIIAKCREVFPAQKHDCVDFAAAVLVHFLRQPGFDASVLADEVVRRLRKAGSPWRRTFLMAEAIAAAKAGELVLAGLDSTELGAAHGHLAVVIGVDGQLSGQVIVPMAYAGSISGSAIAHQRLSGTFNANLVRQQRVEYFIQRPDIAPVASAFDILLQAAARPNPPARRVIRAAPALVADAPAPAPAGSPPAMAWGKKVSAEFRTRVAQIAAGLGVQVDQLMACMAFETGETFAPDKQNPKSKATGLIQFMPSTAKQLGTTIEQLAAMSAEAQLDYVEKYFNPWRHKLANLGDLYMAILWPKAIGKSDGFVLFKQPSVAYTQNAGLDADKNGEITRAEASAKVIAKLNKGLLPAWFG